MSTMNRTIAFATVLLAAQFCTSEEGKPSYPSFYYGIVREHELEPHRRSFPMAGVEPGFHQLRLTLIVSPTGDVLNAQGWGDEQSLTFLPNVQDEIKQWKFVPFEHDGRPVTAEIEEYINFVPPERLPKTHAVAPVIRKTSKVAIALERSGCFGTCPSYSVTLSTEGIEFVGGSYVVASGKHEDSIDPSEVRELAKRFAAADFYSMDDSYEASVTDNPTYNLSIVIDGRTKKVLDYVGSWVGMPAVISDLERAVDEKARTTRWIDGDQGLVDALQAEHYDFKSSEAQHVLKEAASRGQTETVRQLLDLGVPLEPQVRSRNKKSHLFGRADAKGWLDSASEYPEILKVLLAAGASKEDQADKDWALASVARSGNVEAVRDLIAYGANPKAHLIDKEGSGAGSLLIYAAESGNPDMVREILRYHLKLEARDNEGKTAIFAAGEFRNSDKEGARVKCVRLLAEAGADVNARDDEGNTPLHEIYLTDVEEELLQLGADVNARNHDGETPIFTTVDDDAISLFLKHGADLTIRNNQGKTVIEAAEKKGPQFQENLRKAIDHFNEGKQ